MCWGCDMEWEQEKHRRLEIRFDNQWSEQAQIRRAVRGDDYEGEIDAQWKFRDEVQDAKNKYRREYYDKNKMITCSSFGCTERHCKVRKCPM